MTYETVEEKRSAHQCQEQELHKVLRAEDRGYDPPQSHKISSDQTRP